MEEPISRLIFRLTEADNRSLSAFIAEETLSRVRIPALHTRVLYILPLVALMAFLALDDAAAHAVWLAILALLVVLILLWRVLFRARMRRMTERALRRQEQDFENPSEAAFFADRLTVTNDMTHSVYPWEEITSACECADGLYLVHLTNRYLYLPVRFFSPETAMRVTDALESILAGRFTRRAHMQVSAASEDPGEAGTPDREEGTPLYAYDFMMTGADFAEVSVRSGRRVLLGVALALALPAGWIVVRSMESGRMLPAAVAVIGWVIVTASGLAALGRIRRESTVPDRDVSLRWYGDHVTVVTHQADESYHLIPYRRIKRVCRDSARTVVRLYDGSVLSVPHNAVQPAEKRSEWEDFLKENIRENSKL